MPSKEELEEMGLTLLTVSCGRLADDSATDETTAKKAGQLKLACLALAAQTPFPLEERTIKELQERRAALRTRVIEFLSAL